MLATVNNPPSNDRGMCWAFVDLYSVTGQHLRHELKCDKFDIVDEWLRETIGDAVIVDRDAIRFLQAKNGTGEV